MYRSEIYYLLNPHISTRELQRNLGIFYVTVWRILQRHKFHLYHITLYPRCSENDMMLRRQFHRWALRMIREDPTFFQYVLFNDKASNYIDNSTDITVIISPHTILIGLNVLISNIVGVLNTWCGIVQ